MATIEVGSDQPFKSRKGVETVLSLHFRYDPELVALLKDALAEARRTTGLSPAGGWLPDWRYWFCERPAWPTVRMRLQEAGRRLVEWGCPPPPPPPRPLPWKPLVKQWYAQLSLKYHPDRGGSHQQMLVVQDARELLETLLENAG
jgi:hypothetical protein